MMRNFLGSLARIFAWSTFLLSVSSVPAVSPLLAQHGQFKVLNATGQSIMFEYSPNNGISLMQVNDGQEISFGLNTSFQIIDPLTLRSIGGSFLLTDSNATIDVIEGIPTFRSVKDSVPVDIENIKREVTYDDFQTAVVNLISPKPVQNTYSINDVNHELTLKKWNSTGSPWDDFMELVNERNCLRTPPINEAKHLERVKTQLSKLFQDLQKGGISESKKLDLIEQARLNLNRMDHEQAVRFYANLGTQFEYKKALGPVGAGRPVNAKITIEGGGSLERVSSGMYKLNEYFKARKKTFSAFHWNSVPNVVWKWRTQEEWVLKATWSDGTSKEIKTIITKGGDYVFKKNPPRLEQKGSGN